MKLRKLSYAFVLAATLSACAFAGTAVTADHQLVKYGNVQIDVMRQGQGPVIVMLPSLGRSVRDYDQVAERLVADGFRVLRPEPRGIGLSKGPMENLSVHDFAKDVAAVIEHENKGPVVVVGHAWGNFAARQLAADRPDLVRGVVVAAASAGKVPPGSNEKPINADMRKAIDGPSDMKLPEAQRLEYLRKAFFAPGHDPRVFTYAKQWQQVHQAPSAVAAPAALEPWLPDAALSLGQLQRFLARPVAFFFNQRLKVHFTESNDEALDDRGLRRVARARLSTVALPPRARRTSEPRPLHRAAAAGASESR